MYVYIIQNIHSKIAICTPHTIAMLFIVLHHLHTLASSPGQHELILHATN